MSSLLKNEAARLKVLHHYQILDTSPEEAFDDLAFLAAQVCATPISLINFIDTNRQWFKAKVGLDVEVMPVDLGFCSYCVEQRDIVVIPDTWADRRFACNPVVTSAPYVRFYAGVPLISPEGEVIGTLCVIDRTPRQMKSEQVESLKAISRLIMRQLELRRNLTEVASIKNDYKQAQEALRQSESVLSSFFDSAPMMMGIVELANNEILHTSNNAATAKFFGITPAEMRNRLARDMGMSQKYVGDWINYYRQAERTQSPVTFEYPHETADGDRWLKATVSAIVEDYGKCQRFAYIVEDITIRKQAEQKIREQAALLDIATDAIVVRDLKNKILLWNKSAEKLYGWDAKEALGKNADEILYNEPITQHLEIYKNILEHGSWQGELQKITKSGKEILVESRWTLIRDEYYQPKSILVVDTDITQKKQLEKQFLRAQRMESIGTLASGIAHDLNNVLSPILMSVQMLKMKCQDERSKEILTIVENNGKRGANLVKQVLSFARGMEGDRTVLQIKHLIAEMKQIVEQTFPKCITVQTEIQSDLLPVQGDSTQLHQVLMNLCLNARDAMPKGGTLTISAKNVFIDENFARMHLDAKEGSYIVLTITDTGVGISNELLDRIFEPFFTTKEFGKGTGLGLSTVMGIVKGHGGFISVSSSLGKGTIFKVYVPAIHTVAMQSVEDLDIPTGFGEWILVVDDEPAVREITKTSLENNNYKVMTASDGIEAVALYAQYKDKISAAIVDMMMPNMDGATAICALQRMNPLLSIIAVSGLATSDQVLFNKTAVPTIFLPKPYTAQELLKTLHTVIGQ
ncbi:hypothetical protein NUACC21_53410 [Scytonema sp. NUACC21]